MAISLQIEGKISFRTCIGIIIFKLDSKMDKKILSIIIPTYNMEALLDQCLTSLILDTKELREKLDVIVVIDGATDRSSEIAHKYADKFSEMFFVIEKENGNYGSCINAALPQAKGKYVRILDADDSYYTENLPAYLNVLEQQDVDLVLTDFNTVNVNGEVVSEKRLPFKANSPFFFSEIPSDTFIAMHEIAYRSSIFKEIDYHQTEGVSYTDLEWVFHPMSKVKTVFYLSLPIYKYLIGREGQTVDSKVKIKRIGHTVQSLKNQLIIFKSIPSTSMAYSYMNNLLFQRARFIYLAHITQGAPLDLVSIDNMLRKSCRSVYDRLSEVTVRVNLLKTNLPIIKMWRNPLFRMLIE